MVDLYGAAARQPAQKLERVLGIGSEGHFDTCGVVWGASSEKWSGIAATFGLGLNLPIEPRMQIFQRF